MPFTPITGLTLVSLSSTGSQLTSVSLPVLAFSPDGTEIAFSTLSDPSANLLYPANSAFSDSNVAENVYEVNLNSGAIYAISTNNSNAIGNGPSFSPVFSPDGRFIAFQSYSTIFESVTNSGVGELYLKDTQNQVFAGQNVNWLTELSVTAGGTPANATCADLVFRADNQMIAFDSAATNLVSTNTNGVSQIYTKALNLTPAGIQAAYAQYGGVVYEATGAVALVSSTANGTAANGAAIDPVFSPDGSMVAFLSTATNLVAGSSGSAQQIYLKNLKTGAITMVEANGVTPNGAALSVAFSPDGTKLLFSSQATNLVSGSASGIANVYVDTLSSGAISEVSLNADGQQLDGNSVLPVFSADGSRVIFQSQATNLVPGGSGAYYDLYVKNLTNGQIGLVSEAAGGARGNGDSGYASVSANGQYLGFYSEATNLIANDSNNVGNLYVVPLQPAGTPIITLSASTGQANGGAVELLTATIAKASASPVSFAYSTADGTATAAANYTAGAGTLTIPAGATSASVSVPLTAGDAENGSLALQFVAANPVGGAFDIGGSSTEMVGAPIILPYSLTTASASVSAGHSVTFSLTTNGVAAGTILDYTLSGIASSRVGTAESGTLTVSASGSESVSFPILINNQVNGASHLTLSLFSPTAPATILASANVTVTDSFTAAAAISLAAQLTGPTGIVDSAQNVSGAIDGLQSLASSGKLGSVSLTDSGIASLAFSALQAANDAAAIADISGNFTVKLAASASSQTINGVGNALGNTVIFSGTASQYSITPSGDGASLDVAAGGANEHLSKIQALQFSDFTVIVAQTPSATSVTSGNITELYGAVFGRLPDVPGLAYYEAYLQSNPTTPLLQFAEFFLASGEYTNNSAHNYAQSVAGDQQFITDSYQNLLGRTPSSAETAFYESKVIAPALVGLTPGTAAYAAADTAAHAQTLVYFSASAEFLGDVQVTAANPSSAHHWLILI